MISIRCKDCNREIVGNQIKTVTCGCPNMATIRGDKISAVDLSHVVMLNSIQKEQKNVLSSQDIAWQEARRQRKIRRLDFEIR